MKEEKKYKYLVSYYYTTPRQTNGFGQNSIVTATEVLWNEFEDITETIKVIKESLPEPLSTVVILNVMKVGH